VAKLISVHGKFGARGARFFIFALCFSLSGPAEAGPFRAPKNPEASLSNDLSSPASVLRPDPSEQIDKLNDCNWIVTYRGRTYDLAPLTREALARPIENDIRYALQRVPAANEHLNAMGTNLRNARAHSKIGSVFLAGLIASQIVKGASPKGSEKARTLNVISFGAGVFSIAGFLSSWKATRDAKQELVAAVESFNEKSPHKIEPAGGGRLTVDMSVDKESLRELEDAEKNRP